MVTFQIDQLYEWMNSFLWPFLRILGLLSVAPLLGESTIPARFKVGLSAMLALALAPTLSASMPTMPTASYAALGIAAQQVLIGLGLGLTMRIVFAAVQTAGEFIGLQMGLGFASFFDPATGANTAVLARLMNLVAMLVFIAIDGHLFLLSGLFRTFDVLPIGHGPLHVNGWGVLLEWSGTLMVAGLLLALPLMIVLLSINLALGILNRTAQQLSVFAVGFPISLMTGIVLLAVVLPQTSPFLLRLFHQGYDALARVTLGWAGY